MKADYGAVIHATKSIGILKPMLYMNLSGGPVKKMVTHFELPLSDILVVKINKFLIIKLCLPLINLFVIFSVLLFAIFSNLDT